MFGAGPNWLKSLGLHAASAGTSAHGMTASTSASAIVAETRVFHPCTQHRLPLIEAAQRRLIRRSGFDFALVAEVELI